MYYNYANIKTYRQPIKMIVGGEGIGKTYGLKYELLKQLLECEDDDRFEIIWFIRYETDINPLYIQKWQDDLPIEIKQRITVDGTVLSVDGIPFCYFKALSKFIVGKGIPYPKVKHAVFDEFILNKEGRYLSNEMFAFKRWTQSIFRLRPVSWWLLANALSFDNPYFNYFKIKKKADSEWFSNDKVVVHFPKGRQEFVDKALQADYYKLFNDEETIRYGLNAEFYFDNEEFISSQPANAVPKFNLKVGKNIYSLWSNGKMMWISSRKITQHAYALTKSDVAPNIPFVLTLHNLIRQAYTSNILYFESLTTKNLILDRIKCL